MSPFWSPSVFALIVSSGLHVIRLLAAVPIICRAARQFLAAIQTWQQPTAAEYIASSTASQATHWRCLIPYTRQYDNCLKIRQVIFNIVSYLICIQF